MIRKTRFHTLEPGHPSIQPSQPIAVVSVRKETQAERFARLKRTADATGKRFIHVYLEDEKKRREVSAGLPLPVRPGFQR